MEKKMFPKWTIGSLAVVSFYDAETRADDVRIYEVTAREGSVVTLRERNVKRTQSDLVSSARVVLGNGYKSSRVVNGTLSKGLTDPNGVVKFRNGTIGTLWDGKEAIYAQEEVSIVGSEIEESASSAKVKEGDILVTTSTKVWNYEDYYFSSGVWHYGQPIYPNWIYFDHDFYVVEFFNPAIHGNKMQLRLLLPEYSEINGKKGEVPYSRNGNHLDSNHGAVWLNAGAKGILEKNGKVQIIDRDGHKQTAVVWNGVPMRHSIAE